MMNSKRIFPGELRQNDMFKMAGVHYNVSNVDIDEENGVAIITADQMLGRQTWTVEIKIPRDVPFFIWE